MSFLSKVNKGLGVVIAGLGVTTFVMACKNGLIKLPDVDLSDWFKTNKTDEFAIGISEDEVLDLLSDYKEYVSLVASEIRFANMNHDIGEVFASYVYLQENGYISFGDKIEKNDRLAELSDSLGINVATGYADAQNKTLNLFNVLKELGYDAKLVSGEVYNKGEREGVVNHIVCFIKEGGHYFLLDAANKTIFFKSGSEYISMKDESVRFRASLLCDRENGYYPDNMSLYLSAENCYKDCDWFMLDYPFRENQAIELDEFFKDYEANNLYDLEKNISDYLEELANKYNAETEDKIMLRLESK